MHNLLWGPGLNKRVNRTEPFERDPLKFYCWGIKIIFLETLTNTLRQYSSVALSLLYI